MAQSNPFGWAGNSAPIDTTPVGLPQPPDSLIEAAARAVPSIMANVTPGPDGRIALVASVLTAAIHKHGHTVQAACWALHRLVCEEKLMTDRVYDPLPIVPGVSEGGYSVRPVPASRPAPFGAFRVTATESLWKWWREIEAPKESPSVPSQTIGPAFSPLTETAGGKVVVDDRKQTLTGDTFLKAIQDDPSAQHGLWQLKTKLVAWQAGLKVLGQIKEAAENSPDVLKAKAELRDAVAELAEFDRQWEQTYGEPFPRDIDDWKRLAVRAGLPADYVRQGKWTGADVIAIIEGWLLRKKDIADSATSLTFRTLPPNDSRRPGGDALPSTSTKADEKQAAVYTLGDLLFDLRNYEGTASLAREADEQRKDPMPHLKGSPTYQSEFWTFHNYHARRAAELWHDSSRVLQEIEARATKPAFDRLRTICRAREKPFDADSLETLFAQAAEGIGTTLAELMKLEVTAGIDTLAGAVSRSPALPPAGEAGGTCTGSCARQGLHQLQP